MAGTVKPSIAASSFTLYKSFDICASVSLLDYAHILPPKLPLKTVERLHIDYTIYLKQKTDMNTEIVEFLEGQPPGLKEYFFKTGTYPLESYFAALPNGRRPRQFAEFKTNPNSTKEEYVRPAFIAELSGNRPTQVAQKTLYEYIKQFPDWTLHKAAELCKIIFKTRITWDNIDGKLKAAAHICRQQHHELMYWDTMRFEARKLKLNKVNIIKRDNAIARRLILEKSPQQVSKWVIKQNAKIEKEQDVPYKFYTYEDGKAYVTFIGKLYGLPNEKYEVPEDECRYISKISTCRFCWRAAFKPFDKQWAYCHHHKNPKEFSKLRIQYAKSIRPHDDCFISDTFMMLWQDFMPSNIIKVRKISKGSNEDISIRLQEIWSIAPNIIINSLPNVLKHLDSHGVNTKSAEHIVKGLESPLPDFKETTNEARIRKRHYDNFALDYATYAPYLIWAEIWLRYEAAPPPKRGGVRKGAGRPRQMPLEMPTKV